ncbi:MAG TPA: GrpB family protein [Gemmatimonadaceae bacterium]|nr:GrpB family protein [Gemmatimonadaceae bacterium]
MESESRPGAGLGLESGLVRVLAYNPEWPVMFADEADRLVRALQREGVALVLEHSGSTAVRGLDAKPILDMIAGRAAESDRERIISAIQSAGYDYRGEQEIPGRDFFRRGSPRQYHLHLTVVGSTFWHEHRAFRDILRAHPDVAARYASLKHDLAARFPSDREAYTEGKSGFVRSVLERYGSHGTA